MKTTIQAIVSLFLVFLFIGCTSQPEIAPTITSSTQMAALFSTPTLVIEPAKDFSFTESPSIPETTENLVQLPSLSLPEFNARYLTRDIALSSDGRTIAVVSNDKMYGEDSVWIWSTNDFSHSMAGYQIPIDNLWSVAFSPDKNRLAVGGMGKIITLDWKTGDILEVLELPHVWVMTLEFGSDDTLVSTGTDDVVVWDLSDGDVKYSVEGITGFEPNSFAISPDGKTLITGAYDGIQLWDFETGQNQGFREGPAGGIGIAPAIVFSGKGNFLASTGCSEFVFEGCSSGKIIIWKSDSLTPSVSTVVHSSWINNLAFSPNDEILASAGGKSVIKLLNLNSGEILDVPSMAVSGKLPPDVPFLINDIVFLSDGKSLAVSTTDGIQLLDVASMSWMPNLRFILSLGYAYSISVEGDNLNFRGRPSVDGEIIKKLHTGERFTVTDGPELADGSIWWKIKLIDDTEGWIVEMPGWYQFNP